MNHTEAMHIPQAVRNTNQLSNATSVRFLWDLVTTYKLSAVCMPIPLNEPVDVSVFHPLGDQSEPGFA